MVSEIQPKDVVCKSIVPCRVEAQKPNKNCAALIFVLTLTYNSCEYFEDVTVCERSDWQQKNVHSILQVAWKFLEPATCLEPVLCCKGIYSCNVSTACWSCLIFLCETSYPCYFRNVSLLISASFTFPSPQAGKGISYGKGEDLLALRFAALHIRDHMQTVYEHPCFPHFCDLVWKFLKCENGMSHLNKELFLQGHFLFMMNFLAEVISSGLTTQKYCTVFSFIMWLKIINSVLTA